MPSSAHMFETVLFFLAEKEKNGSKNVLVALDHAIADAGLGEDILRLGRTPASLDDLQLGMPIFDDNRDARAWYFLPIQEAAVTHTAAQSSAWEQWDALG